MDRLAPRRASVVALVAALVVLLAAGCTSDHGRAASATTRAATDRPTTTLAAVRAQPPFEDFGQVLVTITSADGSTRTPCLLLADTEPLRERGLMHVADATLGGYAGMVFTFDSDVTGTFTMTHTLIPLSVVFLDDGGHVVSKQSMTPCPTDMTSCPSYPATAPYRTAIEVPSSGVDTLGLDAHPTVEVGGACHTPSP